ncbi:MAG: peptide deformylase [Rhizomicrobium sp.]
MIETMIDAKRRRPRRAPGACAPARGGVPGARRTQRSGPLGSRALRPHRAPDRADQSPDRDRGGGGRGRLGRLPLRPGLRGYVERPFHIRYRGFDLEGRVVSRTAKGFHARVVQHECDHLDGRLYPSRMTDLGKLIFESEAKHWASG